MIDKMGMFKDFNFKLAVIDALLDKQPAFQEELEKLESTYCSQYEWYADEQEPIPELLEYFSQLQLTNSDLDKITEMCFDGGNKVYFILQPDWEGEDEIFNFHDISGIENLKNLKSVMHISMCQKEILMPLKEKGIAVK